MAVSSATATLSGLVREHTYTGIHYIPRVHIYIKTMTTRGGYCGSYLSWSELTECIELAERKNNPRQPGERGKGRTQLMTGL